MSTRLKLPALFVASFVLTLLAIWPEAKVESPGAVKLPAALQRDTAGALAAGAWPSGVFTTMLDDAAPPAGPAPTLQELTLDSDPETRLEAQALLDVLREEAADYP